MIVNIQTNPTPAVQPAPAQTPANNVANQTLARDNGIDRAAAGAGNLVSVAKQYALALANQNGQVSSTDVLEAMRKDGYAVDKAEKRFMGAVFRKDWRRVGYENSGSHRRPVSVWARK
jgi:hypothetical protein